MSWPSGRRQPRPQRTNQRQGYSPRPPLLCNQSERVVQTNTWVARPGASTVVSAQLLLQLLLNNYSLFDVYKWLPLVTGMFPLRHAPIYQPLVTVIRIVANMGEGKRGRSFFGLHCRCDAPTRQARRAESTAG